MRTYIVRWMLPRQGVYVPPGPCGEGDYHEDLYGTEIVRAKTAKKAKEIVKFAYPGAKILSDKRFPEEE